MMNRTVYIAVKDLANDESNGIYSPKKISPMINERYISPKKISPMMNRTVYIAEIDNDNDESNGIH